MVDEKIFEFETFINEKLKGDLHVVTQHRESIDQQIAKYHRLRDGIEKLQLLGDDGKAIRSQVDLGCDFYVQASIPDTSKILIAVGYGFYLELALDEAIRFIDRKVIHLKELQGKLITDAAKIKSSIKVMLEKLSQLQMFKDNKPKHELYW